MSETQKEIGSIIVICDRAQAECATPYTLKSACELTTFKGGGKACVFTPRTESELTRLYRHFLRYGVCPFILGGGSDVILADGLCASPVISTKGLDGIEIHGNKVIAGSGARISDVITNMREHSLGGLEFMTGVPATVGGIVHMNAGAFGAQTADYVHKIRVLNSDYVNCAYIGDINSNHSRGDIISGGDVENLCAIAEFDVGECGFGYRKGAGGVILGAVFEGKSVSAQESRKTASEYLGLRLAKQPRQPSCGSVFKNGEIPSGKLIDGCGLRGTRVGGAMISELHGNFIVNVGGATAKDFMTLVGLCEIEVFAKYGVRIQREFVYVK